ncbi:OB-fold nucleic acid binding domain-containing protein [Streptomyces sp. 4N509B]|uniref:OB-fold nucleic acid binding domain-containing protein n=1 Tax=Streptomyces sp. 4N509B TaxID=3457413 RepID=UPI003FD2A0B2
MLGREARPARGAPARRRPEARRSGGEPGGTTPIRECVRDAGPAGRAVVRVAGTLREVSELSVAGGPALRAELDDGTATLAVVWLGRRAIAGVEPGRALVASGRISTTRGHPVLFNPRYELRAVDTDKETV